MFSGSQGGHFEPGSPSGPIYHLPWVQSQSGWRFMPVERLFFPTRTPCLSLATGTIPAPGSIHFGYSTGPFYFPHPPLTPTLVPKNSRQSVVRVDSRGPRHPRLFFVSCSLSTAPTKSWVNSLSRTWRFGAIGPSAGFPL